MNNVGGSEKCLCGTMQDGRPIVVGACPVHGDLPPVEPEMPLSMPMNKMEKLARELERMYRKESYPTEDGLFLADAERLVRVAGLIPDPGGESVAWECRFKFDDGDEELSWSSWTKCSQLRHDTLITKPELGWEARKLYTHPAVEGDGVRWLEKAAHDKNCPVQENEDAKCECGFEDAFMAEGDGARADE